MNENEPTSDRFGKIEQCAHLWRALEAELGRTQDDYLELIDIITGAIDLCRLEIILLAKGK